MNTVLWVIQVVLAATFLFAGGSKVARPKEALRQQMAWVDDFSTGTVKLIGTLEILAAIGLILPALTGIAPVLTPLAAVGLVVLMALAAATHLRRKEWTIIPANLVLLVLAAVVAWGRFGPYSF
jgi:uncharacterized membrane protein YphA (DoxX/SURF4 family)